MDRAYSVLDIKSVDEDRRIIEGIATTPATDRMEDVVEPRGAKFRLPVPFLFQHNSRQPAVGHVISAKVTDDGIQVRVQIERDDEPGPLRDLLEMAWRSIRKGLVRGLSIGFRPLEDPEPIKGTYGLRFKSWEWLELSAVTIPANAEASITSIKQFARPAASGTGARSLSSPGASGTHRKPHEPEEGQVQTLETLEASREAKKARMEAITKATGDEGRTKTDAERQEFEALRDDIAAIDLEIKDLQDLDAIVQRAAPVRGNGSEPAAKSRDTRVTVVQPAKPEPGIQFARMAMAMAKAKGNTDIALSLLKAHYPTHPAIPGLKAARDAGDDYGQFIARMAEMRTKAAVGAGTTAGETWAGPLVAYNQFSGDFIEYLRPRTIIGQLSDRLRRIPFNVHIRSQTSGGSANWVGQGLPKPVTKFDYLDVYHAWYKVAAISVLTEELIRFSDPSAEALVRDSLADVIIAKIDTDFVDPAKSLSAGVSPASITNGVTPVTSTGTDGDGVRADLQNLWAAAIAANLPLTSAVYITTPAIALGLSLMTNALGQMEFGGLTVNGGSLNGIPVVVSNYVPEGTLILAFTSEIYLSDDGVVTVDASREASIQMDTAPGTQNATTGAGIAMVSMYQTNSVALRAERYINWSKRRSTAVAYLTDVDWGGAVS